MLSEYDSDKDGFISLSEFIGDVRGDGKITDVILKYRRICLLLVSSGIPILFCFLLFEEDTPSQWEIEETVRFKDLYDHDKDGKLNREEQLRWVAPNSYGSAREEVRLTVCLQFYWHNSLNWCKILGFNAWLIVYLDAALAISW